MCKHACINSHYHQQTLQNTKAHERTLTAHVHARACTHTNVFPKTHARHVKRTRSHIHKHTHERARTHRHACIQHNVLIQRAWSIDHLHTRTREHPISSTMALTHLRTHTLMPTLMQTHSCMQVYHSHVFNCCLDIIYTPRDSLVIGRASTWQPQRGPVLLAYATAVTGRDIYGMNSSLSYVIDEHTIHHMAKVNNITRCYTKGTVGISKVYIFDHTFIECTQQGQQQRPSLV